jgi:diguanylate cyclase (GGDEF)-like protein
METAVNLLSPPIGVLAVIALLSISVLVAVGMGRRRQWVLETRNMQMAIGAADEDRIQRLLRAQLASDFISHQLCRIYYIIVMVSGLALVLLPSLNLAGSTRFLLWLALSSVSYMGALVLRFYWRGLDDDRECLLREKLQLAEERVHAGRGQAVRDELTQLYTPEFWLRTLNNRAGRAIRRSTPVTCLMIEMEGLAELREKHGDHVGDDVLARVAQEITHNVRAKDMVCRYRDQRFAIALFGCPAQAGKQVGERVATNVARLALEGINRQYDSRLHLQWDSATLPVKALTSAHLLRLTERSLNRKIIGSVDQVGTNEAGLARVWQAQCIAQI